MMFTAEQWAYYNNICLYIGLGALALYIIILIISGIKDKLKK